MRVANDLEPLAHRGDEVRDVVFSHVADSDTAEPRHDLVLERRPVPFPRSRAEPRLRVKPRLPELGDRLPARGDPLALPLPLLHVRERRIGLLKATVDDLPATA